MHEDKLCRLEHDWYNASLKGKKKQNNECGGVNQLRNHTLSKPAGKGGVPCFERGREKPKIKSERQGIAHYYNTECGTIQSPSTSAAIRTLAVQSSTSSSSSSKPRWFDEAMLKVDAAAFARAGYGRKWLGVDDVSDS
jgi:hypothetical protein